MTHRADGGFRPNDHLRESLGKINKFSNPHKCWKIRSILLSGKKPILKIVHQTDCRDDACRFEMEIIRRWGRHCDGGTLTNLTPGGEHTNAWNDFSEEKKQLIREKIKFAVRRPEAKAKIDEARRKAHTGRKHTPEEIDRRSRAIRGKTANYGAKNGSYGKPCPAHVKESIRAANRGRVEQPTAKATRSRRIKESYMLKNRIIYQKIIDLLDEGQPCKYIKQMLNVSSDVITKVKKERSLIELFYKELGCAKQEQK